MIKRRILAGRHVFSSISLSRHESSMVPFSQKLPGRKKKEVFRPSKVDPSLTSVLLFPGQGAQFVGMGEKLLEIPNVQGMFDLAKRILGYDLLDICISGPESVLDKTTFSQIAVYVTSLAAVEKIRVEHPGVVEACVGTAGFGVGEITALVFAGAFTFEDGLRLVKFRGEYMQYAAELVPGGMMTVTFGADARINFALTAAVEWCKTRGIDPDNAVCSIAAYLFPHCKIIAGHEEALKFLELNGKEFGLRNSSRLDMSGAFHTSLMYAARSKLKSLVPPLPFGELFLPVYSTYEHEIFKHERQVKNTIIASVCKPIKWEQTLQTIYRRPRDVNMPQTFICGGGRSLSLILKNINMPAWNSSKVITV